jgi:putative zinc finger protein
MENKTKPESSKERSERIIIEISCSEVWTALGGYLENEIDADLRRRMQEHFKHCMHCRALVDGANNVIQLVGDGRAFDVPAGFSSRLYRKLEAHPGAAKDRTLSRSPDKSKGR